MEKKSLRQGKGARNWPRPSGWKPKWPRLLRKTDTSSVSELLFCLVVEESVHALSRRNGEETAGSYFSSESADGERRLKDAAKSSQVVLVLRKSDYLVKVFELPKVKPDEVSTMLGLEVESQLPPEYGRVDLSFRPLDAAREGYERYEVYIVREGDLRLHLDELAKFDLEPRYVIPSALIWSDLLRSKKGLDLLVAANATGALEVASMSKDSLSVRAIPASGRDQAGLNRGLVEYLRSFLSRMSTSRHRLSLGWIGENPPELSAGEQVQVEDLSGEFLQAGASTREGVSPEPLLALVAHVFRGLVSSQVLRVGNLLPRELVAKTFRGAIRRRIAVGASCVVLSILLAFLALKSAALRYETESRELARKVASVAREGEAVERRISFLRVIGDARSRRNDFHDALLGLHRATPDGVSYNHVELGENGTLLLRGQAKSLSLPFLLPERLEEQPMFSQVLLRDAGQAKKSGGTVTEFRVDCVLVRSSNE